MQDDDEAGEDVAALKATHECTVCHRVFKLKSSLETHMLHLHMRDESAPEVDADDDDDVDKAGYRVQQRKVVGFPLYYFVCPLCTQGYRDERAFWKHIVDLHKVKTRPYQYFCPVMECNRSSVPATSLRNMQLHLSRHLPLLSKKW